MEERGGGEERHKRETQRQTANKRLMARMKTADRDRKYGAYARSRSTSCRDQPCTDEEMDRSLETHLGPEGGERSNNQAEGRNGNCRHKRSDILVSPLFLGFEE